MTCTINIDLFWHISDRWLTEFDPVDLQIGLERQAVKKKSDQLLRHQSTRWIESGSFNTLLYIYVVAFEENKARRCWLVVYLKNDLKMLDGY